MILDARKGDINYHCYDAKACRMVKDVVWVDDETAQWGRYLGLVIAGQFSIGTVQEERITIHKEHRLVIFNEVDDSENTEEQEIARTAELRGRALFARSRSDDELCGTGENE